MSLRFKFIVVARTMGLISGLLSLSPLHSAAAADKDVAITVADRAAFKAVMQIQEVVKKCDSVYSHDGIGFYPTDNPALLFDISSVHGPKYYGITKSGLYLTDSDHAWSLGSPFGLIYLMAEPGLWCRGSLSRDIGKRLGLQYAVRGGISACEAGLSRSYERHYLEHYWYLPEATSVSSNKMPPLEFITGKKREQADIDAARCKWLTLTREYAGIATAAAAAARGKQADQLAARAQAVSRWVKQSEDSLARLTSPEGFYGRH